MDVFREHLAKVVKSGKYFVGAKETLKAVSNGKAKLVIIAGDTSVRMKADIEKKAIKQEVDARVFAGTMQELGRACVKSFKVSCMAITGIICALRDGG